MLSRATPQQRVKAAINNQIQTQAALAACTIMSVQGLTPKTVDWTLIPPPEGVSSLRWRGMVSHMWGKFQEPA